jgi:hypothetical protein
MPAVVALPASYGWDVLSNVVANLACVAVPLVVALIVYRMRGRRRLRRFYGITAGRRALVQIRLSNIRIKRDGTISAVPLPQTSIPSALLAGEYGYALRLASVVRSRPLVGPIYAVLEQFGIRGMDAPMECDIRPSVARTASLEDSTGGAPDFDIDDETFTTVSRVLTSGDCFVLVGSPVYNLMTHCALVGRGEEALVHFVASEAEPEVYATAITVRRQGSSPELRFERRRIANASGGGHTFEEYFLLQKISRWAGANRGSGGTIFICAGTSAAATAAALETLSQWERLFRDHGWQPFAIVCSVRTEDRELSDLDVLQPPAWHIAPVWRSPASR